MKKIANAKIFSKVRIKILIGLLVMLSTPAHSDECKSPSVTTFAEVLPKSLNVNRPGATAIVTRKGVVLYRGAIGKADMNSFQPLSPEMPMRVGSLTKPFTAAAVMILVKEGKLSLEDYIEEYITDFPQRGITIEHLLVHSSGLTDFTDLKEFKNNFAKDTKSNFVIGLIRNKSLLFKPGTKVSYSNSNYFLLGLIIEAVTNRSYADFMGKTIFEPLDMRSTYIETSDRSSSNVAAGHTRTEIVKAINPSFLFAAGALVTNVDDLARWSTAIDDGLLLGQAGWNQVFTPFKLNNGQETTVSIGWGINELHKAKLFGHEGLTYGYSAMMMRLPDEKLFVAVLSNDDRLHIFSQISNWFNRSDPVCLAGQLATISLRQQVPPNKDGMDGLLDSD